MNHNTYAVDFRLLWRDIQSWVCRKAQISCRVVLILMVNARLRLDSWNGPPVHMKNWNFTSLQRHEIHHNASTMAMHEIPVRSSREHQTLASFGGMALQHLISLSSRIQKSMESIEGFDLCLIITLNMLIFLKVVSNWREMDLLLDM